MQIVLITGISGSGKSVALHALEDAGFFCVDNLPSSLLPALVDTRIQEGGDRLAVATDVRSADSLDNLRTDIIKLQDAGHDVRVLFLTADDTTLITRFSETRRKHPLSHRISPSGNPNDRLTLAECIAQERQIMRILEGMEQVIDTSNLKSATLRRWIVEMISTQATPLTLLFESFGFKYGVPIDADLVFDARMLPNPHYDPLLRPLTGRDQPVADFLLNQPEVLDLQGDIIAFIDKWLPAFKQDNRSYLTVAIGCTGGQHRSVFLVEQLASHFAPQEHVIRRHRQLD